eukprot:12400466-Alexandrium_andersonii.AAC.1
MKPPHMSTLGAYHVRSESKRVWAFGKSRASSTPATASTRKIGIRRPMWVKSRRQLANARTTCNAWNMFLESEFAQGVSRGKFGSGMGDMAKQFAELDPPARAAFE